LPRREYLEARLPNDFLDDGIRLPLNFWRPRVPQNGDVLWREAELQQPLIVDVSEPFTHAIALGTYDFCAPGSSYSRFHCAIMNADGPESCRRALK
jgi:hypothetical protein